MGCLLWVIVLALAAMMLGFTSNFGQALWIAFQWMVAAGLIYIAILAVFLIIGAGLYYLARIVR